MNFTTIAAAKRENDVSYIGTINISSKLKKNVYVNGTYTYCVYLAPASKSGYNVCPFSTALCEGGCLDESGRAAMELAAGKAIIQQARITRTRLLKENPAYFMQWMIAEMKSYQKKAIRDGYDFSARLNGTSDIDWAKIFVDGKNIFSIFPDTMFYDYTKNPNKFYFLPDNYHLTFSYTGENGAISKALLDQGFNVAVVFNVKKNHSLPKTFNGYQVVDGDVSDYRPNDGNGVIVGLRWKRIANKEMEKKILNSVFVVDPANIPELTSNKSNVQLVIR